MAELDDFVKRLGKEPMPADPLQRGLETIAYALFILGQVALQQGDVVTARLQAEESLVLFKEVGVNRYNSRHSLGR